MLSSEPIDYPTSSPDVLVSLGLPQHQRDHYLIWKEGKPPELVIEITSSSTRSEDLRHKKNLYAQIGIKEYCIFDPLREYLTPQVRLYRLSGDEYIRVTGTPLTLETLGLEVEILADHLRLREADSGRLLPTQEERIANRDRLLEGKDRLLEDKDRLLAEKQRQLEELRAQLESK